MGSASFCCRSTSTTANKLVGPLFSRKSSFKNYRPWNDKYCIHGLLSDIVADIKGETHGCFASTVSDDLYINSQALHDINGTGATILQDQRDNLIGQLLQKGRSYANQYEILYRNLIKEFITHLEIEMSKHLDELQRQIETDKQPIFMQCKTLTDASRARRRRRQILPQAAHQSNPNSQPEFRQQQQMSQSGQQYYPYASIGYGRYGPGQYNPQDQGSGPYGSYYNQYQNSGNNNGNYYNRPGYSNYYPASGNNYSGGYYWNA